MVKTNKVLIIDDDPAIRKFIRANLEARGYQVLLAMDGDEGIQVIEKELPDLVILDIMMPKMDGFEVCRQVREWSKVPIIMLSAREGETDKVKCLDSGADDYLTKPFSLRELLARIKAVMRRSQDNTDAPAMSKYQFGALEVDFAGHTARLNGESLDLTAVEDKILNYLSTNAGRVITSNQLLAKVWGEDYFGDNRVLQVNICRLRRKLQDDPKNPRYIQTKPGIGYIMAKPVSEDIPNIKS
jgi:DNA-binding response OmpR family regulator